MDPSKTRVLFTRVDKVFYFIIYAGSRFKGKTW